MDLSALDTSKAAEQGAKLHLRHPTEDYPITDNGKKDGQPVTITLIGADSETFRRFSQSQMDRRLKAASKRQYTSAAAEEDATDLLVACTVGWGNIELDGKDLPFSKENAKLLYDRLPWVKEQVGAFIGERANFLKA